jgi:hypothetical protein
MKHSPEYSESKDKLYAELMAEALRTNKPSTIRKLTEAEILAMQPESTRKAMLSDPVERWSQPIEGWLAVKDAKSKDELVGKRDISVEDFLLHKATQQSRNTLGDSESSSVTPESRTRAVESFCYSKPAELTPAQRTQLTRLTEIVNNPIEIEPEKPKNWKAKWFDIIRHFRHHGLGS